MLYLYCGQTGRPYITEGVWGYEERIFSFMQFLLSYPFYERVIVHVFISSI